MKQHRNVGTVRIVYAQLFAAALLVISCLAISWLSNRIATAQVYGMTDKLYVCWTGSRPARRNIP